MSALPGAGAPAGAEGWPAVPVISGIGSGGGVVAMVHPIQASIPNRTTTARNAVISRMRVGHM